MNKNVTRIGLAAIAAFYVVVGGLWASDYFPLQKFYAQAEIKNDLIDKLGYQGAFDSKEYRETTDKLQNYVLTHPSFSETEAKLAFYKSLLFWATVAIGAGGGVLFLTRNKRGVQAIQGNPQ